MEKVVVDNSLRSSMQRHKARAKEWRQFMSPRVSNTLSSVATRQSVSVDNDEKLQKEEFDKIFKEVEQLGTSQMSWKKRKAIEMQAMIELGAKPAKGHRMPIEMGRNIKRKREKLEQQRLQEESASGLVVPKRERKSIEKPSPSSRGLKVSEGVFKGGVLYVQPLTTNKEEVFPSIKKSKGKSVRKGKKGKHKGKRKRGKH